MTTIYFENPGEIDPRVITTMGVNVKEGESPIGFFGTGLKYAIAVCLRHKQEVQVFSGTTTYTFRSVEEVIRGKPFQMIQMAKDLGAWKALGFTTDLGKNWTIENAYRELHSNCLDECGEPGQVGEPMPRVGRTAIAVRGGAFAKAHRERHTFLLDPKRTKLASNGAVEMYTGSSNFVFYRGIAALKLDKPSLYLYNITEAMELTEDRTLESAWTTQHRIGYAIAQSAPKSCLEAIFTSKETFEEGLDYYLSAPSEQCLDVIEEIMKDRPLALLDAPRKMYFQKRKRVVTREKIEGTREQLEYLRRAVAFCHDIGFPVSQYPIHIAKDLGDRIIALAEGNEIWLSPKALEQGVLEATLIEEFIHLRSKVLDCTRIMQEVLFNEIVRLGAELIAARKNGV